MSRSTEKTLTIILQMIKTKKRYQRQRNHKIMTNMSISSWVCWSTQDQRTLATITATSKREIKIHPTMENGLNSMTLWSNNSISPTWRRSALEDNKGEMMITLNLKMIIKTTTKQGCLRDAVMPIWYFMKELRKSTMMASWGSADKKACAERSTSKEFSIKFTSKTKRSRLIRPSVTLITSSSCSTTSICARSRMCSTSTSNAQIHTRWRIKGNWLRHTSVTGTIKWGKLKDTLRLRSSEVKLSRRQASLYTGITNTSKRSFKRQILIWTSSIRRSRRIRYMIWAWKTWMSASRPCS